jgi:predicted AlkP superfamily phosphohydrolase/phosphomutase
VDTVHPPHYFAALQSFVSLSYDDIRLERELPDIAALHESLAPTHDAAEIPVLKDYWIYVLQEALTETVSRHLYQTEEYDFFATYFRLPDIVQHVALTLIEPDYVDDTLEKLRRAELSDAERAAFQDRLASVLEPFYAYMASLIDAYASNLPDDAYLIVVSDHGFALHGGGYDHYHIPESMKAPDGIFLMLGPGVVPGEVTSVSVYDIAPSILYLYGLPVGESMDGEPLTAALDLERDVQQARYGPELMTPKEHRRDEEIDEQTLEELRSLGYIQ